MIYIIGVLFGGVLISTGMVMMPPPFEYPTYEAWKQAAKMAKTITYSGLAAVILSVIGFIISLPS